MEEFNKIISEIGKSLGIKVTLLSDKWLTVLEKNGQIHYIQGYKFDLNHHGIGNIMDDKGLFYDLMTYKNLPIIEHHVIFNNYKEKDVINYFNSHDKHIVVKGNIGTCGKEVFEVFDEKSLLQIVNNLFQKEFSLSLCPYYDILNEYRVIILNNEARIVYGKSKPKVIGDGIHSLKELAKDFQNYYDEYKIDLSYIPLKDEEVELSFQFNLSNGARMFLDIDKELRKKIISIALKVTKSLNITFGSVDIIYTKEKELLVMEANSGVMMNNYIRYNGKKGYNDAYNLYKDAIELMFKTKK